ncbi:MAG TPA: hypothetical protein VH413_17730 [Verrucomicrobiae bacterium]|jgi:hypothetical protein|nr:hypothetical protein [Verrucomicrobiae bacterium]
MSFKTFCSSVSELCHQYPFVIVAIVLGVGVALFIMFDAHHSKKEARSRHRWK